MKPPPTPRNPARTPVTTPTRTMTHMETTTRAVRQRTMGARGKLWKMRGRPLEVTSRIMAFPSLAICSSLRWDFRVSKSV
jgi:hypothetical protein